MDAVRAALPPGAPLLLVAGSGDAWHARLWQRGLYPRNTVIVRFEPWNATALRASTLPPYGRDLWGMESRLQPAER